MPMVQAQTVDWSTKPHMQRVGPNLVTNSGFSGVSDWALTGATYDSSVTRSADGSGSIKLIDTSTFDIIRRTPSYVPVTGGETYTFSAYMMSNTTNGWPPPIVRMHYTFRSATGINLGGVVFGDRWGNSNTGVWEELSTFIDVPVEIGGVPVAQLDLQLYTNDQVDGQARAAWVDDVYLGLGRGFEQPPAPKAAFDGTQSRVDALGNMEVLRNGTTWEPFFPLAMYGDGTRPDWSIYANQGFNMEMRALSVTGVEKARDAGLMAGVDISGYMTPGHPSYNDAFGLQTLIADLKSADLMDDIPFFYWDNEQYDQWSVPVAITDVVKQFVVDRTTGERSHPIYSLNQGIGKARRQLNDQVSLSDITGTYIGSSYGVAYGRTNDIRILDNIENQKQPAAMAQINRGVGNEMRARLFGAIAHGARGMGFWRDYYNDPSNAPVEDLAWWGDFPAIASEINQMLDAGLIQQPHWTEWSIDTSTDGIDFGTRNLNGEGYLIAANYNDSSSVASFTLGGLGSLGYTPTQVRDFFTGALVATLTGGNQFDVLLGANSSGVYRLVAGAPGSGTVDLGSEGIMLNNGGALASQWIRSDSTTNVLGPGAVFIGSLADGADLRGILAFDLTGFEVGDIIDGATVSLFHVTNDTFDHQDGTISSSSLELSLITNAAYDNNDASWDSADQSAGTAWGTAGGDFGSALATVAGLDLTAISANDEVAFNSAALTAAIQAAVDAGESQISFMLMSPDLEATMTRNFFVFRGGFAVSSGGVDIGPNLNIAFVSPPMNLGDFDGDNDVDGADFLVWQRGGSPNGATPGDLAEWETNFGTVYGGAAAAEAIPEPSTSMLTLMGIVCLAGALKRQFCY